MPARRHTRPAVTQPSDPSYKIIALTRGQSAFVDAADYDHLMRWPWSALDPESKGVFYAVGHPNGKFSYMHRFILQCTKGEEGDHENHDTLDNRRNNLRKCTRSQNGANQRLSSRNSSGFKGVSWMKTKNKWRAYIAFQGNLSHIGVFICAEDAAKAYDAKARELFGPFAHTNFPIVGQP